MALELQLRFGEKFESRATVQASQKLNLESLLRDILKQVMPQQEAERKGDAEAVLMGCRGGPWSSLRRSSKHNSSKRGERSYVFMYSFQDPYMFTTVL